MKAIIVTAGNFHIEELTGRDYDLLIGVDGGCDYLAGTEYIPHIIIGDFDSINQKAKELLRQKGVEALEFEPEKDMTDTHIAIEYAVKEGATELVLLGATGTRLDHTLANIFLLESLSKVIKCMIVDNNNQIHIIASGECLAVEKKSYRYLSLLPISEQVSGVVTSGLKYPLNGTTLKRSDSYGISNEILEGRGSVKIQDGVLAVIQSKD